MTYRIAGLNLVRIPRIYLFSTSAFTQDFSWLLCRTVFLETHFHALFIKMQRGMGHMAAKQSDNPRDNPQKISSVSRAAASVRDQAPDSKLTLQRGEPADAFITGASRSLQRRVSGLNIPAVSSLSSDPSALVADRARRARPAPAKPKQANAR